MSKLSHPLQLAVGTSSSTANHSVWFNRQISAAGRLNQLQELLYADPILQIFTKYNMPVIVDAFNSRVINTFRPDLTPGSRNNILKGLTTFANVVRKIRKEDLKETLPSWNMRRSMMSGGVVGAKGSSQVPLSQRLSNFTLPGGITNVPVPTTRVSSSGGYVHHLSFDGLRVFAKRLMQYEGQTFHRTNSLSRYGTHKMVGLTVEEDKISYTIVLPFYKAYPSSASLSASTIDVVIRRLHNGSQGLECSVIELRGLDSAIAKVGSLQERVPFSGTSIGFYTGSPAPSLEREKEMRRLTHSFSYSIGQFRPAFYHTQGRAMREIMIDYDKNFENLVESASFLSDLRKLALSSESKVAKIFDNSMPVYDRIRSFATLFTDASLAWSFGIKPTIEAIDNLIQPLVSPISGEGEIRYTVDSISSLPQTMQDVIFRYVPTYFDYDPVIDCLHLDARFRSFAWTYPTYQAFAEGLWKNSPALAAGIIPSPSGIYNASTLSFTVDWVFGVSTYIDDFQTYATSFTIPFRIGHTAQIDMFFSDGRRINVFLRSIASSSLFDPGPDGDSWLNLPPLPPISLALTTSMLFG